jgi:hypothetical protein
MALFDAELIIEAQTKEEEHTFELDRLELPEGMDVPTLTITITKEIREKARNAKRRFSNIKFHYEGKQASGELIDQPEDYCRVILQKAYKDSSGLFENNKKAALLALIDQKETFAKYIASLLMEFFAGEDIIRDDEEEKN